MTRKSNLISIKDIGIAFGTLGGQATLKKHGRKHYQEMARKRWGKNDEKTKNQEISK